METTQRALTVLCTEDAIRIGPEGPICVQQAIEKKVCRPLPAIACRQNYMHSRLGQCARERFAQFQGMELNAPG
jgi:hypothetical protein